MQPGTLAPRGISMWPYQLTRHQERGFFALFASTGNVVRREATDVWAAVARAWTQADEDSFLTGPSTLDAQATRAFRQVMASPSQPLPSSSLSLEAFEQR